MLPLELTLGVILISWHPTIGDAPRIMLIEFIYHIYKWTKDLGILAIARQWAELNTVIKNGTRTRPKKKKMQQS